MKKQKHLDLEVVGLKRNVLVVFKNSRYKQLIAICDGIMNDTLSFNRFPYLKSKLRNGNFKKRKYS